MHDRGVVAFFVPLALIVHNTLVAAWWGHIGHSGSMEANLALEYLPRTDTVLMRGLVAKLYNAVLTGTIISVQTPPRLLAVPVETHRYDYPSRGLGMLFSRAVDANAVVKLTPPLDLTDSWTVDFYMVLPRNKTKGYSVMLETADGVGVLAVSPSGVLGVLVPPTAMSWFDTSKAVRVKGTDLVFVPSNGKLPSDMTGWHQFSAVFSYIFKSLVYYVDGVRIAKLFMTSDANIDKIAVIGNSARGGYPFGSAFARVQIYFSQFREEQLALISGPGTGW